MSEGGWELSQTLASVDGLGIRCVAVLPPLPLSTPAAHEEGTDSIPPPDATNGTNVGTSSWYRMITGNQGGRLVEYTVPSGAIQLLDQNQHNDAVTAILSSSPSSSNDTNCVYLTACKDGMIRIYHSMTHQLVTSWLAHSKPVTSLAFCDIKQRFIVTGSWDGTAKVWDVGMIVNDIDVTKLPTNQQPSLIAELPNHENSVCVTSMGSTTTTNGHEILNVATGSAGIAQGNKIANHTTRIWNVDVVTGTSRLSQSVSNDHDGPIRDVQMIASSSSAQSFLATCSNDGTVRLRDTNSGATQTILAFSYEAHPPMLLSMTDVAMENNNNQTIVASAEAGQVVFWELDPVSGMTTGPPQVVAHADCVWNVMALPNHDAATCCQDGMVRIFTRNSERIADAAERQHFVDSVSNAIAARQNGPSSEEVAKLHPWHSAYEKHGTSEGQVHLFNKNGVAIAAQWSLDSQTWVEVGEVVAPGANTGDSAGGGGRIDGVQYDHVLPIEIEQTSGQVSNLKIGYNIGENPFTAAQRFIDAHMLQQNYLNEIANYITQRVGKQPTVLGMSSAATTTTAQPTGAFAGNPIVQFEHILVKAYKSFDLGDKSATTTLEKMKIKIVAFGCDDIETISVLMSTLLATNRYHVSKVSDLELSTLYNLLTTNSIWQLFPALDLARLSVLHPDAASHERSKFWYTVIQDAVVICKTNLDASMTGGPAATANPMLSLRLFTNAMKGGSGSREAVVLQAHDVLDCAIMHVSTTNKNIRLSVATLLYNICFYIQQQPSPSSGDNTSDGWIPSIVTLMVEILSAKIPYEKEALIRTMIAMGSIARVSPTARSAFNANYLASKVEPLASPHGDVAKAVAKEVYNALLITN
jgi:phospholipase A-2-activating protein